MKFAALFNYLVIVHKNERELEPLEMKLFGIICSIFLFAFFVSRSFPRSSLEDSFIPYFQSSCLPSIHPFCCRCKSPCAQWVKIWFCYSSSFDVVGKWFFNWQESCVWNSKAPLRQKNVLTHSSDLSTMSSLFCLFTQELSLTHSLHSFTVWPSIFIEYRVREGTYWTNIDG